MFDKLPSLREFEPKFYTGAASREYLALFYDIVALLKPRCLAVIGAADGQAFLTIAQAVRENSLVCRCLAAPARTDEVDADVAWQTQRDYVQEFYRDIAQLFPSPTEMRSALNESAIELLLIDDIDSGSDLAAIREVIEPALSDSAVVLFHGVGVQREDAPGPVWHQWSAGATSHVFNDGLGLAISGRRAVPPELAFLFSEQSATTAALLYRIAAGRIAAATWATAASRENAALQTRQIWLDSMLANGWRAQEVMDYQAQTIADLEQRFAHLSADRIKAQEIIDEQLDQLKQVRADRTKAQAIIDEQLREIAELRAALDRADAVVRDQANDLQQLQALRADRLEAQRVLDEQAAQISVMQRELERLDLLAQTHAEQLIDLTALRRDRAKAQLVMDSQQEQLQHWVAISGQMRLDLDKITAELKERKQLIKAAKEACRRNGKCFQIPSGPKVKRPLGEKFVRELQRLPRNLGIAKAAPIPDEKTAKQKTAPAPQPVDRYDAWIEGHEPDAAALEKQRVAAAALASRPRLSVVVPVFNTSARFLDELIASFVAQTYDEWELCIADAGSSDAGTAERLESWISREPRVRVVRLPENLGISENTNRALELATGDFVLLVDHDDLLPPFAFYEIARAINAHPDAEIFYTDEDRLSGDGKRHTPFFKPDWSPALLCSFMYVGHLTAYRRELVTELGGFRKEYDLSQDYDFALRATERAREIVHVPHVCYHWREHAASANTGGKPDARKTNLAALGDAMRRRNLPAEIIEYPFANRARLKVATWPRVSVIVPTDSATRAQACLVDLARATNYSDLEVVIVTNSRLVDSLRHVQQNARVQLVRYDKPFNFSDKCNEGAAAATGSRLIFFNDDVEAEHDDWIQNLIEQLEDPSVGAVAPKLLYDTGKIQHAGLVTAVRGFAGTAFHQRPGDWTDYFNMAQSLRDVSALSGACLAMRRDDFVRLGGWDTVNTPIAHSDFDLCFKIREAGMRCVYTPFATLHHAGHVSIGDEERQKPVKRPEKVNVFLLQRWAGYTTHDPFFPDNMRDWLYHDSPTPIRMSGRNNSDARPTEADLLFVSHDLSWSGAPLIVLQMAKWCAEHGFFVTVMSPKDGPLRQEFAAAAIPVIVDPLIETGHESFTAFAAEFDCVIASTIFGSPIIHAVKGAGIPHFWWIHEGRVAEHYIAGDSKMRRALAIADRIVTPDTRSSQLYQPFSDTPVRVLPYGIVDPALKRQPRRREPGEPLRFLLLGTVEHRKGQQVLLEALEKLPDDILKQAQFNVVGRAHDLEIAEEVKAAAKISPHLHFSGGVSPDEALKLIAETDVMLSASWDETGPLILMEAAALEKALLSTNVGAVGEFLTHGEEGLFFKPGDADALAAAIERLVRDPALVVKLGKAARHAFEQHFAYERFGSEFVELIHDTIRTHQPIATAAVIA